MSFLVIAPGGGNTTSQPGVAPTVISRTPKHLATGIATDVLPQATFSEPVKLGGRVSVVTDDAARIPVAIQVLGIRTTGDVVDVTASDDPVTSITIKPLGGLSFSKGYAVVLAPTITDTDPAPDNTLADGPWTFTTFGPEAVGGTEETFGSPGIALMGDRAYLVENGFSFGTVKAFDVSDPVAPQEIESARANVTWRPVDLVGAEEASISSGRLLLVATGPTNLSKPSNLYLFDVSSDARDPLDRRREPHQLGHGRLHQPHRRPQRLRLRGHAAEGHPGRGPRPGARQLRRSLDSQNDRVLERPSRRSTPTARAGVRTRSRRRSPSAPPPTPTRASWTSTLPTSRWRARRSRSRWPRARSHWWW